MISLVSGYAYAVIKKTTFLLTFYYIVISFNDLEEEAI